MRASRTVFGTRRGCTTAQRSARPSSPSASGSPTPRGRTRTSLFRRRHPLRRHCLAADSSPCLRVFATLGAWTAMRCRKSVSLSVMALDEVSRWPHLHATLFAQTFRLLTARSLPPGLVSPDSRASASRLARAPGCRGRYPPLRGQRLPLQTACCLLRADASSSQSGAANLATLRAGMLFRGRRTSALRSR